MQNFYRLWGGFQSAYTVLMVLNLGFYFIDTEIMYRDFFVKDINFLSKGVDPIKNTIYILFRRHHILYSFNLMLRLQKGVSQLFESVVNSLHFFYEGRFGHRLILGFFIHNNMVS